MFYSLLTSPPQILSLPSTDWSTVVDHHTSITFLDEFRMMVLVPEITRDILEFTLFDTLIPCGHPVNSRQFRLPQRYHDWSSSVHVDGDRCLGTLGRDRPLTADPTQGILVMRLANYGQCDLLIVRIQTLVEHVRSMSAGACVPWDVWGRGAVVMEIPTRGPGRSGPFPLVQGVHVVIYVASDGDRNHHHPHLYTFDLSRWGCGILPLWDGGSGNERRISFEGGRKLSLQGGEGTSDWLVEALGDGRFTYLVSRFCHRKSGSRLISW